VEANCRVPDAGALSSELLSMVKHAWERNFYE
jgi:hypothetical protein